jgi:hypothetical protein
MKHLARIILVLCLVLINSLPAFAATTADVTLYATPLVSGGISTFTITYISDTNLKLDWGYSGNATAVMIRAKYGSYPTNISSSNETPSDGYLVYNGGGVTTNDTSMDFNANPGPIYYRAWAQDALGQWFTNAQQGNKESRNMILIALILLCAIFIVLAVTRTSSVMYAFGGFGLLVLWQYILGNPPTGLEAGTTAQQSLILLLVGGAAVLFIVGFVTWRRKGLTDYEETSDGNGRTNGVRRVFHLSPENGVPRNTAKPRTLYNSTPEEYSRIVYAAAHGGSRRRRR